MNASDRLNSARQAAFEGRHEEALIEYIWFHDHALEEEPSQYGVRLSFALAYWVELGEAYPKAKRILKEIRDNKTTSLLRGEGNRETFHDIESINRAMNCSSLTYLLFVQLVSSYPVLAESCAGIALPAIVGASDYHLAARYLSEPEKRIKKLCEFLNQDIEKLKQLPRSRAPMRKAHIHVYVSQVQLIVSVLAGLGQSEEADRLRIQASKLVKSPTVRRDIRAALASKVG